MAFVLLITNLRFLQPPSCGISTLDNQPQPPPPSFPTSCCCTLLSVLTRQPSFLHVLHRPLVSCRLYSSLVCLVPNFKKGRRRGSKFVFGLLLVACSFRHATPCKDPLPFSSLSTQKEFTVHVCVCVCVCACVFSHACFTIYNI